MSILCEAGLASSMEDALQQDWDLAEEVLQMRYFDHVVSEMKRDKKTLTKDREQYLEQMERLSEDPEYR